VDVDRYAVGVGPQAVVHLLCVDEFGRDLRCLPEDRPQMGGLYVAEVANCGDVALWLHDQCPNAERPDAVLDQPASLAMDETTW
jgi:hypothetical protein